MAPAHLQHSGHQRKDVGSVRQPPHVNHSQHGSLAQPSVPEGPTRPNRTPEAMAEETSEEVRRLESAVSALGEDNPHAKPLVVALKAAKAKLNISISVQIE